MFCLEMGLIVNPNMFFKKMITSSLYAQKRVVKNCLCARSSLRSFSNNKRLSDTSIILQSGMDMQELPLVVKKLSSVDATQMLFCEDVSEKSNHVPLDVENSGVIPRKEEVDEIVLGFENCNTIHEVLKLLEILPSTYVEPNVAFHIIKKMSELDENHSVLAERMGEDVTRQNFTTTAVFNQLIDTILSNNDCATFIKCLKLMNQRSTFRKYFEPYREKLVEKILMNVSKNGFSVTEICEIADEFRICGHSDDIDKLWVGIADNAKSIDVNNIITLFHSLSHFKSSRNIVLKTLLERMVEVWWYMEGTDIIDLLTIVKNSRIYSHQLMQIIGRWLNTKIHVVSEDELLSIVRGLSDLNFVNTQVIAALERYVKVRSNLISNPGLVAVIMDYFNQFNVRSTLILERACDFFISKGGSLSPANIRSLIVPFGNLHFTPTRSYEFWKTFEQVFEDKFTHFQPEHVVDIMLSCIFLEKYPINFVNYIFNSHFLTRLQICSENWSTTKHNLALFDHHMSSNCPAYRGPLLPKEIPSACLSVDKQLKLVLLKVKRALLIEYSKTYFITESKIMRRCPISHRCMIDIFMRPRLEIESERSSLALLIHMPEDFTYDGENLLGLSHLRIRHFTNMGLKVISLNYLKVVAQCISDCDLAKYLSESINEVVEIN